MRLIYLITGILGILLLTSCGFEGVGSLGLPPGFQSGLGGDSTGMRGECKSCSPLMDLGSPVSSTISNHIEWTKQKDVLLLFHHWSNRSNFPNFINGVWKIDLVSGSQEILSNLIGTSNGKLSGFSLSNDGNYLYLIRGFGNFPRLLIRIGLESLQSEILIDSLSKSDPVQMIIAPNDNLLVFQDDGVTYEFDLLNNANRVIPGVEGDPILFSPDSKKVLFGINSTFNISSSYDILSIFDLEKDSITFRKTLEIPGDITPLVSYDNFRWDENGLYALKTSDITGQFIKYNVITGDEEIIGEFNNMNYFGSRATSSDYSRMIYTTGKGGMEFYCLEEDNENFTSASIKLLDFTNQSETFIQENFDGCQFSFSNFMFSPDGTKLAFGFDNNWLDISTSAVYIMDIE